MTPDEMRAYCRAQLATIAREMREAQSRLLALDYARQAYQDMIDELARREEARNGLDHPHNVE
jgi:hypothetical protein